MTAEKEITETKRMPMIAMRGIVLFPNMILHFDVGRKKSIAALEEVMKGDRTVFLSAQKNIEDDEIDANGVNKVGVVAEVRQVLKTDDETINKFYKFTKKIVKAKNNKYGIITIDNKKIVPFIYDDIQPFLLDNDIIMCRKNEKWGAINVYTGKTIIPFEYDEYNGCFENKLLSVRKEKCHNGYINTKGNVIIPLVHEIGLPINIDA